MASTAAAAGVLLASTRKTIDALLAEVGGLLADLTSPTDASEDEENEQARRVIDVELQRFWQSYYELKRRHDENSLSVAVLALTKSGKSTLLNSLMGMEVLPMNNVPETARICRIMHDATAREPVLRDGASRAPIRGEAAIRARLQELNSAARTSRSGSCVLSPQSSGNLTAGGAAGSGSGGEGFERVSAPGPAAASMLDISAPLVALEGFGPEFGRVVLLDTPGPNEAGEEQLKHQVERLLEGVDCVLYLLDYTKLKTAEEEGLFRRLRAINPQLVARLSSRLFFVINKVDACETSEGLDPDEVRAYVAELVTRQLGGAAASGAPPPASPGGSLPGSPASAASGLQEAADYRRGSAASGSAHGGNGGDGGDAPFRLHPDQVLLLSARNALLARLVLTGRAGPEVTKRFQRLAFGAFGFGGMGRGGAAAGPSAEQVRAAAGCLLEGSGVLDLEGRVLAFLAAHAGSVKMLATADDTARLLAQVRNVALACHSCLQRNVSALQQQAGQLRADLAEAGAAFEEVRQKTDAVQAEVVAEIKAHLNTLRRRLFTHIVQTLDTDPRAPPPGGSAAVACGSAGRGGAAGNSPLSRWTRVREKFLSMFTATSSSLPPHGASGSGSGAESGGFRVPSLVPEARSRSRDELQALLLDLHDDVMGQIHSEVYDFWGVLEACAASRHSELLSALNGHLAALSRRVEGSVAETLGVQLAPADIRLRPPSAEQLHSDVQELIEKGIRESTEKHIRVGTRTTTERVLRQPQGPSLCRWGGYWVDVPRTRTVVETYTATVYSLKPDEIANHFIGLVDGAVSASERALSSYVGALVERQLAAARERLKDYGDRYLGAMTAALSASSRGAEYRSTALAAVEGYLARLEQLAQRAEQTQRDAEAAVPGGAAGLMDEVEVFSDEDDDDGGGGSGVDGDSEEEEGGQQGVKAAGGGAGEETEEARAAREEGQQEFEDGLEAGASDEEEWQADEEEAGEEATPAAEELAAPAEEQPATVTSESTSLSDPVASAGMEPPHSSSTVSADLTAGTGSGMFGDACSDGDGDADGRSGSGAASSAGDRADQVPAHAGAADSDRGAATPLSASWSSAAGTYEMVGAEGTLAEEGEQEGEQEGEPQPGQGDELLADTTAPLPGGDVDLAAGATAGELPGEAVGGGDDATGGEFEEDSAEAAQVTCFPAAPVGAVGVEASEEAAPSLVQEPILAAPDPAAAPAVEVVADAAMPARAAASPVVSGSSSGLAPFSGPFDYRRAFLEAMSSSGEVAAATVDDTLTMIPLTADGVGSQPGSQTGGGGGGQDTPRSGASEEWQLVGEESVEELDGGVEQQRGPALEGEGSRGVARGSV